MNLKLAPFLLLIFIFSCNKKGKQKEKFDYLFEKKEIIQFPLNDDERFFSYDRVRVINDSIIAYANTDFFITLFNLNSKERVKVLRFKKEGPNGVKDCFRSWLIKDLDSVFFIGQYSKWLKITNFEGEIIDKKKIALTDSISSFNENFTSPLLRYNDNLIISVFRKIEGKKFLNSNRPISCFYDFKSNRVLPSGITYMDADETNNHPMLQGPISCLNENKGIIYYLFRQQNVIKSISLQNKKINNYPFNLSNGKTDKYKNHYTSTSFSKFKRFFVKCTNNFSMYFDPYRNLIYLLVSHGISSVNEKGEKNHFNNKPFSIVVFNDKLEKLGEEYFKGSKYELRNCFVAPKGFYISLNNSFNDALDENKLVFQLLKIRKGILTL